MIRMRFQLNRKLLLLFYGAGVVLAIAVAVLLLQVDRIVNVSLYSFGLQFDYEWATPYWTFLRLGLGLLGCLAAVNVFSLIYIILTHEPPVHREPTAIRSKPSLKALRQEVVREKAHIKTSEEESREVKTDGVEVVALPMVCNKCGKVFSQPLCMFDFKSGKPRLVNVCPYCNAVLAVSGNSKT